MSGNVYELEKTDDGKSIIKLHSEVLGGNDALTFQNIVSGVIESEVKTLYIDMADVQLINSSGLGMLISAVSHLRKSGKRMELMNVPDKVKSLLKITQFDKIFNL